MPPRPRAPSCTRPRRQRGGAGGRCARGPAGRHRTPLADVSEQRAYSRASGRGKGRGEEERLHPRSNGHTVGRVVGGKVGGGGRRHRMPLASLWEPASIFMAVAECAAPCASASGPASRGAHSAAYSAGTPGSGGASRYAPPSYSHLRTKLRSHGAPFTRNSVHARPRLPRPNQYPGRPARCPPRASAAARERGRMAGTARGGTLRAPSRSASASCPISTG